MNMTRTWAFLKLWLIRGYIRPDWPCFWKPVLTSRFRTMMAESGYTELQTIRLLQQIAAKKRAK